MKGVVQKRRSGLGAALEEGYRGDGSSRRKRVKIFIRIRLS